jgi:hypothetical protein
LHPVGGIPGLVGLGLRLPLADIEALTAEQDRLPDVNPWYAGEYEGEERAGTREWRVRISPSLVARITLTNCVVKEMLQRVANQACKSISCCIWDEIQIVESALHLRIFQHSFYVVLLGQFLWVTKSHSRYTPPCIRVRWFS